MDGLVIPFDTVEYILGYADLFCAETLDWLAERGHWFMVMPLPDNVYALTLRVEDERRFDQHLRKMGYLPAIAGEE